IPCGRLNKLSVHDLPSVVPIIKVCGFVRTHKRPSYRSRFTTGDGMKKNLFAILVLGLLLIAVSSAKVQAEGSQKILAITMTNDPDTNAVIVIDALTHARLQTLSTNGKGGVSQNARGVAQVDGRLFAAVNNGSGTVAVFKRAGDHLVFEQLVVTTSAPVSVD